MLDNDEAMSKLEGKAVSVELTSVHFGPAASPGEGTGTFEMSGVMGGALP